MFLGLDTDHYPGDAMMQRLRPRFSFTGFYLAPAPSHPDAGWMTKLPVLQAMRYGTIPIYVGQELVGLGRHNMTAAQGMMDGADAGRLMRVAGYVPGSYCYLDLENGPPFTALEAAYVVKWCVALRTYGYKPGLYGSHLYADALHKLVPDARIWTVHTATTATHRVITLGLNPPPPAKFYDYAIAAQFDQNAVLPDFGNLEVDLNSSVLADPSAP